MRPKRSCRSSPTSAEGIDSSSGSTWLGPRIHAGLGDIDQAFSGCERPTKTQASRGIIWLKVDPTLDSLRSDPRFDATPATTWAWPTSPPRQNQGIQSVAVLPLENIGDDPKTEFLSDGLADQIINSLLQVRRQNLKVRPFTSVSRYKTQKPDLQTIARDLNVQAIVTGSLHQQGDDLSIGVELVDAREDNRLWGKRYQGKLSGILDLQDQIARDVAANLRLRLTGEEEQRLTKRYTEDSEAYLLYREGDVPLEQVHRPKDCERPSSTSSGRSRKTPTTPRRTWRWADCYGVLGVNYLVAQRESAPKRKRFWRLL